MKLLTATAAAAELGLSRTYLCAAKKAGLKFSHGRRTTTRAILDWLAEHPNFKMTSVYSPDPKCRGRRRGSAKPPMPLPA